jgi:hypothetical protein
VKDICKKTTYHPVRPNLFFGLTFFVCLLISCRPKNEVLRVEWRDERAMSVSIPKGLIGDVPDDSIPALVEVRLLKTDSSAAIFGNYENGDREIRFSPLIPFTHGLHYGVWVRGTRVGSFEIPAVNATDRPELTAIYPTGDTLPENLLKIHLYFSRPMREGQSGKYVTLLKNGKDTVSGAFLDLQPELWNADRTMLTLWLDPGRIKRDLQPNQRLGTPMQRGSRYRIMVSQDWQDTRGAHLSKSFEKSFVTTSKDSLSPVPSRWKFGIPEKATSRHLEISFGESLDYSLLQEVFSIKNASGVTISGKWSASIEETQCAFEPEHSWQAGKYVLQIENRLEDLAGNSLKRPFDRDISGKRPVRAEGRYTEISFHIP